MPTYDYQCEHCGYEFEKFQSIKARSLRKCPKCGKNGLKRLMGTGAGIIFKGSGFYQTDYRSESYNNAAKKEKESTSSTKSDNKDKQESSNSKDSIPASSKTKNDST